MLVICINHFGICQDWTNDEIQKANTALNISTITFEEKEVIKYLNLARLYPQKFAIIEVKDYLGPEKYGTYLKTSVYKQSLLTTLQNKSPVGALYFDERMYLLASCFAKESGDAGIIGHNRILCSKGQDAECCSYGQEHGKDIAINLLIDHDVPSLGHRKICLDDSYGKVGASIKPHRGYENCCVVDFKRATIKYPNNLLNNNSQTSKIYQPTKNKEKDKPIKIRYHKLLSLKIGGNANLMFDDFNNINHSFQNQLSYQLNTMIGFNLGKKKRNTSIGLFGNYGKYNKNNTSQLSNHIFNTSNNSLEIEGGFLIKEIFRLSGGLGYSSSNSINLSFNNYSTFSAGISMGPKWFKLDIMNTLILPQNNKSVFYRTSIGLSFVLNFVKKRHRSN